jgi:CBS domain-containing protein
MSDRHLDELLHDAEPLTLPPSATVDEAARRMREKRSGAVLVIDHGELVGIFTGRDAVCRVLAAGRAANSTALGEVMTPRPATAAAGLSSIEALRLMQDCGVRHLPVVERGAVVGIVSRGDFGWHEKARLDEETGYFERTW